MSTATPSLLPRLPPQWAIRPLRQEREPLFFRVEPDRLPLLLRPFDDERPFAVVRLRPPPDEPRPFEELLLRLDDEPPRAPEDDAFVPPDEDLERPPDELPLRLRPEAEDFDLPDDELRLRALDDDLRLRDERFLTSPSSMTPRQDPVSSSSISM
jgi:hypothetical protein